MSDEILLDAPDIGELEKQHIYRALDTGYVATFGPYVAEFEKLFMERIGLFHAVAVQSGTAALYMSLRELGIGPGDEVIVPALTFAATINVVMYTGATPVIADVDQDTWNISPEAIKGLITPRTRAIIPVHLYGNPCDMGSIMALSEEKGLCVVEDATESLGATYQGKSTGTFGEFGCFSFNGNKIITTGGGGMVVGKKVEALEHIRYLINQAKGGLGYSAYQEMGFNYRLTNLAASMGLAQIARLDEFLIKKKKINQIYRKELSSLQGVKFPEVLTHAESSWWLTCVELPAGYRVEVIGQELADKGVPTRRIFPPLETLPAYASVRSTGCPAAKRIFGQGICLPSSTVNSEVQIQSAARTLKEILMSRS